jgi:hypothetical protein
MFSLSPSDIFVFFIAVSVLGQLVGLPEPVSAEKE